MLLSQDKHPATVASASNNGLTKCRDCLLSRGSTRTPAVFRHERARIAGQAPIRSNHPQRGAVRNAGRAGLGPALLLATGKVFIGGGSMSELYDPATSVFATGGWHAVVSTWPDAQAFRPLRPRERTSRRLGIPNHPAQGIDVKRKMEIINQRGDESSARQFAQSFVTPLDFPVRCVRLA